MKMNAVVFLAVVFCLLFFVVMPLSQGVNNAIDTYAEIESRDHSPHEKMMESRQTAVSSNGASAGTLGALIVSMLVLTVISVLAYMKFGADFHKQRRLAKKKPKSKPSNSIFVRQQEDDRLQEIAPPTAARARNVPQLPDRFRPR